MTDNVNNFFEKVKAAAVIASDMANDAIDATSKKAEQFFSMAKLAVESGTLQSEINDIYKELGKLVYEAHVNPGAQPDGVEEKLGAIDEKKKRLEELEVIIESKKNIRQCPNEDCGAKTDKKDDFCRRCGQRLVVDVYYEEESEDNDNNGDCDCGGDCGDGCQ